MKRRPIFFFFTASAVLLGLAAIALLHIKPSRACESMGGKWASVQSSCVTRMCYLFGDCGKWAFPYLRCPNLKVGDSRAEVYFQLGNPDGFLPGGARWHAAKDSAQVITVTFRGDQLQSLSCPATP